MAKECAFCGAKLNMFASSLVCGNVSQPVCKDCGEKYAESLQLERCRELLKGSWAAEPEKLRAFLAEQEREAEAQRTEAERLGKLMNCCGQPMTPLGVSEFQLGCQGWILGDLPNLLAGAMELAVFRCEHCGQIRFMDPEFIKTKESGNPT